MYGSFTQANDVRGYDFGFGIWDFGSENARSLLFLAAGLAPRVFAQPRRIQQPVLAPRNCAKTP
jgi:hypothetical protein